jgi:hypothetical protein
MIDTDLFEPQRSQRFLVLTKVEKEVELTEQLRGGKQLGVMGSSNCFIFF